MMNRIHPSLASLLIYPFNGSQADRKNLPWVWKTHTQQTKHTEPDQVGPRSALQTAQARSSHQIPCLKVAIKSGKEAWFPTIEAGSLSPQHQGKTWPQPVPDRTSVCPSFPASSCTVPSVLHHLSHAIFSPCPLPVSRQSLPGSLQWPAHLCPWPWPPS